MELPEPERQAKRLRCWLGVVRGEAGEMGARTRIMGVKQLVVMGTVMKKEKKV